MRRDSGLSRLSLNQRTTAEWSLREAIDGCVGAGLSSIGVWREQLAEAGQGEAVTWLADAGLRVSTLCRGGFFTPSDPAAIEAAHEENLRALDEAAALGAATLCLVPGACRSVIVILPERGSGRPTRSGGWFRTRGRSGSRWASSR